MGSIDMTFIHEHNVQRGIDRLNQLGPVGWPGMIDRDILDITCCDGPCILDQIYGNYQAGVDALGVPNPYDFGFASNDHLAIWKRRLEELNPIQVEPQTIPETVREPVLAGVA